MDISFLNEIVSDLSSILKKFKSSSLVSGLVENNKSFLNIDEFMTANDSLMYPREIIQEAVEQYSEDINRDFDSFAESFLVKKVAPEKDERLAKCRAILHFHSNTKIDGYVCDPTSANLYLMVWEKINENSRKKLSQMDFYKAMNICWKLTT